jgi:hypothetical protein
MIFNLKKPEREGDKAYEEVNWFNNLFKSQWIKQQFKTYEVINKAAT